MQEEVAHLLEARSGAEIEHVVPAVGQPALGAVHVPDPGLAGDGSLQAGADRAVDRPRDAPRPLGLGLGARLAARSLGDLLDLLGEWVGASHVDGLLSALTLVEQLMVPASH